MRIAPRLLPRHWALLVVLAAYWCGVWATVLHANRTTGGSLVYPLDDTYIHMAMAKNFACHGVWGVTRHSFCSATSAPLWTLLLSGAFAVFGVREVIPLLMALLAGSLLIGTLYRIFQRQLPRAAAAALALVVAGLAPLPALTVSGMEHALHMLLAVVFADRVAQLADTRRTPTLSSSLFLVALAPALSFTRYEGLFLVFLGCGILLLRRRARVAVGAALSSLLPIAVYGAVSKLNGWLFFPNAIVIKGSIPFVESPQQWLDACGYRAVQVLMENPYLFVLIMGTGAVALLLGRGRNEETESDFWFALLFLPTAFAHVQLASIGWFYRYDAYIVCLGLTALGRYLPRLLGCVRDVIRPGPGTAAPVAVVILLVSVSAATPLVKRAVQAAIDTPKAMVDRYLEHIQPARFLATYYPAATVLVNDIGAVSFYTDCRILDMFGICSMEPVRYRREPDGYGADDVAEWVAAEGATLAILQVQWYHIWPRIPEEWSRIWEWRIPRNVVFNDTEIGVYPLNQANTDRLLKQLNEFMLTAPADLTLAHLPDPRAARLLAPGQLPQVFHD